MEAQVQAASEYDHQRRGHRKSGRGWPAGADPEREARSGRGV